MMKLSFFFQDLHRTYEGTRGKFGRTNLCRVDYLVDNLGKVVESISRIELKKNIESEVRRYNKEFQADMQSFNV